MKRSKKTQKPRAEARTVAGIDVGSNAVRMVIGQILPDGEIEVLERLQQAVRLGQDTFRTGRLKGRTMRAAIAVLRDFQQLLKTYKVEQIKAVATSAVREAANCDTFVDRVMMSTGLDLAVISTAEESRLTVSALRQAVGKRRLAQSSAIVAEVGGGSTVVNLLRAGEITASQNLAIGSIRLQEVLETSTESAEHAADIIRHQVHGIIRQMKGLLKLGRVKTFYAVGGDARWAADRVGKSTASPELKAVTDKDLDDLISSCEHFTADELVKEFGLNFSDAETLNPALLIYQALVSATSAREIIVSNVSMRYGLLLDMARGTSGKQHELVSKEIIHAALSLAEKYRVDLPHAQHVRDLCMQLFDYMCSELLLDFRHRTLLEAAALLHEIGTFVSGRAHHKHSYYLIVNSEIPGLTQEERAVVAHIARYHRRSRPKPSHLEYMGLSRENRMIVNKLAALLRVADALEASRTRQITDMQFRKSDDNLVITVNTQADLTLERRSLAIIGDLFEDISGMTVQLEQV